MLTGTVQWTAPRDPRQAGGPPDLLHARGTRTGATNAVQWPSVRTQLSPGVGPGNAKRRRC